MPPTTDREPEPAEQIGQFLRVARGAFSASTKRALKSDLAIYAEWCAERGERTLPASPETIAAFVDDRAETRAPATVRLYVTSLAIAHRALGLERIVRDPLVKLALQRMHRRKGRRQGQAAGLTLPLRQRMLEAAGHTLPDDRNRAMLAVAYDAMLRRSELVTLQVTDMLEELKGDGSLLVRRSKTDREGRGEIAWISADTVRLVRTWRDRARISDGLMFRSVAKGGRVGNRLHPCQVPRIFKSMARAAGLQEALVAGLSGHSARVGAAQDMVAAGIELPAILQAGRWKSVAMVNRYGERRGAAGPDPGAELNGGKGAYDIRKRPATRVFRSKAMQRPRARELPPWRNIRSGARIGPAGRFRSSMDAESRGTSGSAGPAPRPQLSGTARRA